MNTFAEALKKREMALNAKLSAVTNTSKPQDPLEVRVRLMLDRKEIEVHFNRYPGDAIINDLKAAGFRWNSPCWFASDSEQKRAFCRARFNATELEPYDIPTPVAEPEKPMPNIIVAPERPKTAWETYTQQIDELLAYFRERKPEYCPGDLQLAAIAAYHKAVFSQN